MAEIRNNPDLSHEYLKTRLSYDETTGDFTWLSPKGIKGKKAGHLGCYGYWRIAIKGITYQAHRLSWFYYYGSWPEKCLDHMNQNRVDNRIGNLREADSHENHRNKSLNKKNTSGFNGVHWGRLKNRWQARIHMNNKNISLGSYVKFEDAVNARKKANKKYGFHENHGNEKVVNVKTENKYQGCAFP